METVVNNTNAVIYARYSSDNQTEQSIEGQVRVITEYAQRNKIPIINSYIDRAISGRRDDRPEFQKMIADSKQKQFGYVLVYKFDRFSRDRFNSLLYKKELRKNGVKVLSVTEYISDDAQGILFESIIDGYSEFYSAELAQKVKRGNRESRLKGQYTGGFVLYGYEVVDKKYRIKEEDAAIVRKIFKDVVAGKTFRSICEELNSQGLRHNGKEFRMQFIGKTIKNQKYMGRVEVDGELFTNIFPPIIDEELFMKASTNAINNQSRAGHFRPNVDYLLSNLVYCGCCGKKFVGESGLCRNKTVLYYYKCNSRKKSLGPCESETFRKEYLEDLVVNGIKDAIFRSDILDSLADSLCEAYNSKLTEDPMIAANEKALNKINKEVENMMNAIKAGIFNEMIKDELDRLQEEKKQLELEQLKLKARSKSKIKREDAKSFLLSLIAMNSKSSNYKKILIQRFVKKVVAYNDRLEISLYPIDNHNIVNFDKKEYNNNGGNENSNINEKNGLKAIKNMGMTRTTSQMVRHLTDIQTFYN